MPIAEATSRFDRGVGQRQLARQRPRLPGSFWKHNPSRNHIRSEERPSLTSRAVPRFRRIAAGMCTGHLSRAICGQRGSHQPDRQSFSHDSKQVRASSVGCECRCRNLDQQLPESVPRIPHYTLTGGEDRSEHRLQGARCIHLLGQSHRIPGPGSGLRRRIPRADHRERRHIRSVADLPAEFRLQSSPDDAFPSWRRLPQRCVGYRLDRREQHFPKLQPASMSRPLPPIWSMDLPRT